MNYYEEKKEAKKERYTRYAKNAQSRSDAACEKAKQISSYIPFGQPILVGHHSEKRHRADINRIDNNMRKSVKEQEKSDYWTNRAEAVDSDYQINSDDPEAITKLEAKVKNLLDSNEKSKAFNKRLAKWKTWENLKCSEEKDLIAYVERKRKYYALPPDSLRCYYLDTSRNTQEVRRLKGRISGLKKADTFQPYSVGGINVRLEEGQIRIYFPGKPNEEIRTVLKKTFNFKFSRWSIAWVRKFTPSTSGYFLKELREYIESLDDKCI